MSFFLSNTLGFFLQVFPCTLMLFLPFSEEMLYFPRKWIFVGNAIASAVLAAVLPGVLYLVGAGSLESGVAANFYMLGAIALALTAYLLLVREVLMKKLLVFYTVLFYAVAQYYVANMIQPLTWGLPYQTDAPAFNIYDVLIYAVTTALLVPLMLGAVIRPLKEFIREIDPQTTQREFVVTTISTTVGFILIVYCNTVWQSPILGRLNIHLIWIIPLFLFLVGNEGVVFWLVFREAVRRQRDNERQRAMEVQQMQYEKIAGDMENSRRMRHDLRHHYNILNNMLDQGKLDEMSEYLAQVVGTVAKWDNEVYCRNMTVNGLLQYYVGLAKDEGIRCEVQAECDEMAVEPVDLTVLFGNTMENAIHACQKYRENRWIIVKVGMVQGSLAIEISNPCKRVRVDPRYTTGDKFWPAEAFLSDHKDGGYGLRSLAYTAKKYGGSAMFWFNAEAEIFTVRIRVNMYPDAPIT